MGGSAAAATAPPLPWPPGLVQHMETGAHPTSEAAAVLGSMGSRSYVMISIFHPFPGLPEVQQRRDQERSAVRAVLMKSSLKKKPADRPSTAALAHGLRHSKLTPELSLSKTLFVPSAPKRPPQACLAGQLPEAVATECRTLCKQGCHARQNSTASPRSKSTISRLRRDAGVYT